MLFVNSGGGATQVCKSREEPSLYIIRNNIEPVVTYDRL